MNKVKLGIGILILVITLITNNYFDMPDVLVGILEGMSFGIIIISIIKILIKNPKKQPINSTENI